VYLLRSLHNPTRSYVGLAANVADRLVSHNAGESPHTARHRPWQLVVALGFANEVQAAQFEKYLKSGPGRAFAERHF
jgi:predicted GIY-YIG superfamily endonuclease